MEQYLTGYAQFLQNLSKSQHTVKQYVLDAKHFVAFWQVHENDQFSEVQALYREYLLGKYAAASVNRKLAGTRKFVHFLYDRAYINGFNDAVFEPVEQGDPKLQFLTPRPIAKISATLDALVEQASDEEETFLAYRHKAMFELFLTTGIKPYEAIQMQWQHINDLQLTVLQHTSYRRIEIEEHVVGLLQQLKGINDRIFGEQPHIWLGLGNRRGEPITEKTIERSFAMLSKYVGFKVTATMCRYTFMLQQEEGNHAFEQIGYSRKDVMTERLKNLTSE